MTKRAPLEGFKFRMSGQRLKEDFETMADYCVNVKLVEYDMQINELDGAPEMQRKLGLLSKHRAACLRTANTAEFLAKRIDVEDEYILSAEDFARLKFIDLGD